MPRTGPHRVPKVIPKRGKPRDNTPIFERYWQGIDDKKAGTTERVVLERHNPRAGTVYEFVIYKIWKASNG